MNHEKYKDPTAEIQAAMLCGKKNWKRNMESKEGDVIEDVVHTNLHMLLVTGEDHHPKGESQDKSIISPCSAIPRLPNGITRSPTYWELERLYFSIISLNSTAGEGGV